ncbi:MAG: QueT transporter family protein [Candidatus Coproplasma sp.]
MTKKRIATIVICRAAIIAALYVALTLSFGQLSFLPIQIRPAEALTILPLFYPEAIVGLYIGCMLANLTSPFLVYDVFIGSLATLLAGGLTYLCGRYIKNKVIKVALGGLFPVLCNGFIIPLVMILCGSEWSTYWFLVLDIGGCEALWVYALGIPLFVIFDRLIKKEVKGLVPSSLMKKNQNFI